MCSILKNLLIVFIFGFCLFSTSSESLYAAAADSKGKEKEIETSEKLYASIDSLEAVKKIAENVLLKNGNRYALGKVLSKHIQATAGNERSFFYTNISVFLKGLINYGISAARAYVLDREEGGITLFAEVDNPASFGGKPDAIGHYKAEARDTRIVAVCIAIKNMIDERLRTGSQEWDYSKGLVINAFPAKTIHDNACDY